MDRLLLFQVDQHDVGIGADSEHPLLGKQTKGSRWSLAAKFHAPGQRDSPFVDAFAQHHWEHRLDARGESANGFPHVTLDLHLLPGDVVVHMIGSYAIDIAIGHRLPELVHGLPISQRDVYLIGVVVERQVNKAGLADNFDPLVAGAFNLIDAFLGGGVNDVERGVGNFSEIGVLAHVGGFDKVRAPFIPGSVVFTSLLDQTRLKDANNLPVFRMNTGDAGRAQPSDMLHANVDGPVVETVDANLSLRLPVSQGILSALEMEIVFVRGSAIFLCQQRNFFYLGVIGYERG